MLQWLWSPVESFWHGVRDLFRQSKWVVGLQLLGAVHVLMSALMLYKTMILVSGSPSPVVVVLSGSMEPAFFRGDILFLWKDNSPFEAGEVIVFSQPGKAIPVVHRVIQSFGNSTHTSRLLTKGDNNSVDDRFGQIYVDGTVWLAPEDVLGRMKASLPLLGYFTVKINEYPAFKYAIIAGTALLVLFARE